MYKLKSDPPFGLGDKVRCTNTQLHEIFDQVGVIEDATALGICYVRFPNEPLWCLFESELEHA